MKSIYPKTNYDNVVASMLGNAIGAMSFGCGLFEMYNQHVAGAPYEYDFMYLMVGVTLCIILGTWIKYSIPMYHPPTEE